MQSSSKSLDELGKLCTSFMKCNVFSQSSTKEPSLKILADFKTKLKLLLQLLRAKLQECEQSGLGVPDVKLQGTKT